MEQRPQRILAETDRYQVTGSLRVARDGYGSRLSDYLNAPDRAFLALTDVELVPLDGDGDAQRHPFLALAIGHIRFVVEAADQGV